MSGSDLHFGCMAFLCIFILLYTYRCWILFTMLYCRRKRKAKDEAAVAEEEARRLLEQKQAAELEEQKGFFDTVFSYL